MARRRMGIQHWSYQPIGNMLRVAEGNEIMKRKTLVIKEIERELNNVIEKEKHRNKKPK